MSEFNRRLRKLDEIENRDLWDEIETRSAQPTPSEDHSGLPLARRLMTIGVAMAVFAASAVFLIERFSNDRSVPQGPTNAVYTLGITCSRGGGATVDSEAVQIQPDGVHLRVDNTAGEDFFYMRDPLDAGNSVGLRLLPHDVTGKPVEWMAPGSYVAGCFSGEFGDRNDPLSAYSAPFQVVDPNAYYPDIVAGNTCHGELPPLSARAGESGQNLASLPGTMTVVLRDPDTGQERVLSAAADGSFVRPLIQPPKDAGALGNAQLSPDGTKIALEISDSNGDPHVSDAATEDGEIWIANVDGSGLTKLTDNHSSEGLVGWTPNGSRLTFMSNQITERDRGRTLYTMALDGTDVQPLLPPGWDADSYSWSPDGSQLAFIAHDRGDGSDGCSNHSEIYVMPADGSSAPVALTHDELWEQDPVWSPDGVKIAYQVSDQSDERWDIMVMNADGSDAVRLTDHPGFDASPIWSPDGSAIVFTSDRGLPGDEQPAQHGYLWIMGADGSGQQPLFTGGDLGAPDSDVWITGWSE